MGNTKGLSSTASSSGLPSEFPIGAVSSGKSRQGPFPLTYTTQQALTSSQDNGGKIVLLEKLADVLIDDYARKFCAPGSVSWKYIDQCVASGELANIEDYRIHQANVPRPVGSSKPVRGIRVPFTKEDEQILVTWVRRAGKDASGNAIYQLLAGQVRLTRQARRQ
jgi:hypothetical protein